MCEVILSDWRAHQGNRVAARIIPAPDPEPEASQAQMATNNVRVETPQPIPANAVASNAKDGANTDWPSGIWNAAKSSDEEAKRKRQHADCLKLAADNPSITCK